MKYLFINSVAGFGSTGRIAAELCRALTAQGHTCVLAYGRKEPGCADLETVRIGGAWDVAGHVLLSRLADGQGFGSRRATRRFLDWVRRYDPDVIWLHNLHGYYLHLGELFGYLKTCGKSIRWTLHDCWAFTGHCAYFDFAGCGRWQTGCRRCPERRAYPRSLTDGSRRNYARKKALFTGVPNMELLVPSKWLKSRVERSFLREYPIQVVPNRVDEAVFKPTPGDFRARHGLEKEKIVLGVASVWDRRKGLGDFVTLAEGLPDGYRVVLIGLTPKQARSLPENILALPRTNSPQELAQAYTAADVYVNPSLEETFGMTVLEALRCGTAAVVYQGTACQEIVDALGGAAVPPEPAALLAAVLKLTKEETP